MRRRVMVNVMMVAVVLGGCGAALPPAPAAPPALQPSTTITTVAAPTTAARAVPELDEPLRDLRSLQDDEEACAQSPPGPSCRAALPVLRSVADRLKTAVATSGDPTPQARLIEYAGVLTATATGIEAYCYGEHGKAVDPKYCQRFANGISAVYSLITVDLSQGR